MLFAAFCQVTYEQGIAAIVLMLYLCAIDPPTCQLLKQNHCLQSIRSLILLPSTEIKLLSKALIARLIPIDAVSDDMAVLMLIKDDEVDYLMSMLTSVQSYKTVPIISVMTDLGRSPHNMFALASREVAVKLSDIMDSSEDDPSKATQLISSMMELNYEGSEEVSAVINNGTLQEQSLHVEGKCDS